MPLYEYVCAGCGLAFEKLAPLSASGVPQPCPACGTGAGRRLSACTIVGAQQASARRTRDRREARAERLKLPLDQHPPKVTLGKPPSVPQRYLHHMHKHGGC